LSKDELLERKKQSFICDGSHILCAFNILAYYKSNNIVEDFDPLKLSHKPNINKPKINKPEFGDFIEPKFNFNPDPFIKFKDLAEPKI
jgi:hypothetical protein